MERKHIMRVIAVANQKGGVGKTTTTINLSAALAEKGKKVLVVDIDPQGNTTNGYGVDKSKINNTIYEVLLDACPINTAVIHEIIPNVDIIPSNVNLAGAEIDLIRIDDKFHVLAKALDYIKNDYDFILLDCPPSLSMITVNAFTAANTVLVPIQCEYYALEGLSQLINSINLTRKELNPKLNIDGIVFTMFDARTNLSMEVVENVRNNINSSYHIYQTIIPRSIRLAEAPSYGQPITIYDTKSAGATAYRSLAEEVINRKI